MTGSAVARCAMGFCQCLSVHRRFLRVRWPTEFLDFLKLLDQLTLDLFGLVPAECAVGRIGYYTELLLTLFMPVAVLLVLFAYASLLAPCARRRCSLRSLRSWPQVWDLAAWSLLVQFPTLCRKTLAIFECVPYEDGSLLRADPHLVSTTANGRPTPSAVAAARSSTASAFPSAHCSSRATCCATTTRTTADWCVCLRPGTATGAGTWRASTWGASSC